jgi:rubrerythrin
MKNGNREQLNRTGSALSPELTRELLEGARRTEPSAPGNAEELARVRVEYARQAEPVGTIPPFLVTGAGRSAASSRAGKTAEVLLDKLGERMAFERSGTRLYDALLSKHEAYGSWPGGPSRKDLLEIRTEEHAHFTLVKQSIEALGGDSTAVTPSANLHAVASKGLCAVISDARTNLREGLEAILVAELVDNDCWENLIDLSRVLGHEDLAIAFTEALAAEREHLRRVRLWLGASLSGEATGKIPPPAPPPAALAWGSARASERQRAGARAAGQEHQDDHQDAHQDDHQDPEQGRQPVTFTAARILTGPPGLDRCGSAR